MSLYGVTGYHVTLSHDANHLIYGNTCVPSCGTFVLFVKKLFMLQKQDGGH